jgi:hypothetical protein
MPIILTTWESEIGRIMVPGQANSSQDHISKITRKKCTGDLAQAVEHLLCRVYNIKLKLNDRRSKLEVD